MPDSWCQDYWAGEREATCVRGPNPGVLFWALPLPRKPQVFPPHTQWGVLEVRSLWTWSDRMSHPVFLPPTVPSFTGKLRQARPASNKDRGASGRCVLRVRLGLKGPDPISSRQHGPALVSFPQTLWLTGLQRPPAVTTAADAGGPQGQNQENNIQESKRPGPPL